MTVENGYNLNMADEIRIQDKESGGRPEERTPTIRRKIVTNSHAVDGNAIRPEVKEEVQRKSREIEVK
jgi:hypothetical protein